MIVVYMAVTHDKYELPLAIADSVPELAKLVGVSPSSIYSALSRGNRGQRKSYFLRITLDKSMEDDEPCTPTIEK